jgi:tetratricopeptide (TPR) repeat protein
LGRIGGIELDIKKLNELVEKADQKMNSGDFKGALNLALKMQSLGSDYRVGYIVSGLLIDNGWALGDEQKVKEGVELLQKDFKKLIQHAEYAPTTYYNLANGYYALFQFKRSRDQYYGLFNETELNKAKFYFRKALESSPQNAMFMSKVLVNLGNCYDTFGRVLDALECYEKALKHKPTHGMALANKGVALQYYAALTGEHQSTYLLEAYSLLSQALKLGVNPEAVDTFLKYLDTIKRAFPDKKILDNPPKFPGYTIKAKSKFERYLIEFCLEHGLYLNICGICNKCDAAIGDTVVIKEMLVPANSDHYLRLSSYLNQIKQDYVTARFLLILSRYKGLNLNFVDKRVTIIDTLDHSIHNIYVQLIKESFKSFYNVLDKIACFVNDYLDLGIHKKRIYFGTIWYSNWKNKIVRKKIEDTKNSSLNALFDIYRDFDVGPYNKLKKTRNALTHRFVNIRRIQKIENEENMKEDTFVKQTIELARIVKSAVIYLLYFVYWEEKKKEAKHKGNKLRLVAQKLPDELKSYR